MATEVVLPMLGVTIEKGHIVEWLKNEGDSVERGESLFVVEADKVSTEVESPATGVLAKILVPIDVEVPVLTVVALIAEPGETLADDIPATIAAPSLQNAPTVPVMDPPETEAGPTSAAPHGPLAIVPAARKLAQEKGLDLSTIAPSGPDGVILLKDVESASQRPPRRVSSLAKRYAHRQQVGLEDLEGSGIRGRIMRTDVQSVIDNAKRPELGKVIPMESMRQTIARRLSQSASTAPHIYFFTDIMMDPLLSFRREILPDFEKKFSLRLSVNDLLIKAMALNIRDYPILNGTVKGAEIHIPADINICLAVALDNGLIVPAIANADRGGLVDIVRQRIDLVNRARLGKLTIAELERGTFTISSLAQYDVTHFTAILNPPQSGILSVGKTQEELFLTENGTVKTRKKAVFGLAVDHRIIDGAVAAEFLQAFKAKLERPSFTFLNL